MAKRVKLGPELKRNFAARGLSMSRVAKELGMYENSLRSWIRRNRFPKRELLALSVFAGFGKKLEVLQDNFLFDIAGERKTPARRVTEYLGGDVCLDQALAAVEEHAGELSKGLDLFPEQLRLLFRSLGQGDLYVHCALDRYPHEADGTGWSQLGKDLAASVSHGACLLYMYPDREAVEQAKDAGLRRIPTKDAWKEFLTAFEKRVMQVAGPRARRQFISLETGPNPFLIPGVQFLLFKQSKTMVAPRVLVVFPLASRSAERTLLLPAAESVAGHFLEFLSAVLEESGHGELAQHG